MQMSPSRLRSWQVIQILIGFGLQLRVPERVGDNFAIYVRCLADDQDIA